MQKNKNYYTWMVYSKELPVEIIEVGIERDNIASLRIFRQVGFIEKGVDVDDLLNSL